MRSFSSVLILAVSFVMAAVGPSQARESNAVPPEVAEFVSSNAIDEVTTTSSEMVSVDKVPDVVRKASGASRVGAIQAVHAFSSKYRSDGASRPAVAANRTWIAPVLAGPDAVATVLVSYDSEGALEVAEIAYHEELANALGALNAGSVVVYDSPAAAWFELDGDTLVTLYAPAGKAKYTLTEYGQLLSEYARISGSEALDMKNPLAGGNGYLAEVGSNGALGWSEYGAFLVALALLVVAVRAGRVSRRRGEVAA